MRKILLSLLLAVGCFAELQVVQTKDFKIDPQLFFGVGMGVGVNSTRSIFQSIEAKQTYPAWLISGKVGAYQHLTSTISLRYYYNLDLNYNFGLKGLSPHAGGFYVFSQSHTLNTDVMVNLYNQDKFALDFIGGAGMGIFRGAFGLREDTVYEKLNAFLNFDFRFNIGFRVMFDQQYGLELLAKIPVSSETKISTPLRSAETTFIRPYYFTLDFVMERF